jgi:hypothetical protein
MKTRDDVLNGEVHIKRDLPLKLKQVLPGIYETDIKKGEEVLLYE